MSKLLPEANKKITEQKEKINDLPLHNLKEIFSKTDKGEVPKELKFFVGGLNNEIENRVRPLGYFNKVKRFFGFSSVRYLCRFNDGQETKNPH